MLEVRLKFCRIEPGVRRGEAVRRRLVRFAELRF